MPEMLAATPLPLEACAHPPGWTALLERFYARAGVAAPKLIPVAGKKVPRPYRELLVHSWDMTPTLEGFYRQPVGLAVLSRELNDQSYLREVILNAADEARPVEYGVIRICLNHLPPAAARLVLEEARPFGHILHSEAIPHLSWPQAFFRMQADEHARRVLGLRRTCWLYGRRNVLLDASRRLLAEVIEILAPVANSAVEQAETAKDLAARREPSRSRPEPTRTAGSGSPSSRRNGESSGANGHELRRFPGTKSAKGAPKSHSQ